MERFLSDVTNIFKISKMDTNVSAFNIIEHASDVAASESDGRKSIWQVDDIYHCSIIGTCLTLSEQKKLLAKEKCSTKGYSPYEIHRFMISKAKNENRISRRTNNLLNQKYDKEISEFSQCSEWKFLSTWNEKLKTGQICGLYWMALTNGNYPSDTIERIFGDVHMLSHINGGEVRSSLNKAAMVQEENIRLRDALKREKETRRQMMKNLCVLEKNLADTEEKYRNVILGNRKLIAKLTEDFSNEKIKKFEAENTALKDLLAQEESKSKSCERSIASLKNEKKAMRSELSALKKDNKMLTKEIQDAMQQFSEIYKPCDESCPAFNLCKKRVLIVGGITKMKNLYRDLIEQKGGLFDYDDGYMRNGENTLEGKVRRSDIVFCPVDVNSHNACLSVKKICRKADKPYWMLSNSSLTSISQSLMKLAVQSGRPHTDF